MKIVIDIPEKEYERMKEQSMFGKVDVYKHAIKNGIPLTKGHKYAEDVAKSNEEKPKVYETKSVLTGNRKLDSMISDAIDEEDFCVIVSDKYTRSLYNYVRKNHDKLKSIGYELNDFNEFAYISITWDDNIARRFIDECKVES